MDAQTQRCFHHLLRFPSQEETRDFTRTGRDIPIDHTESQIAILIKDMQGVIVDQHLYTLTPDYASAFAFVEYLHDVHSRLLFKNPIMADMKQFMIWFHVYGYDAAVAKVEEWIKDTNEYKYLTECLGAFLQWCPERRPVGHGPLVRYYGPVGTSGYARACSTIIASLMEGGQSQYRLQFVPVSVQNMNPTDACRENVLMSKACGPITLADIHDRDHAPADVVIIHSVPDMWIPIVKKERSKNPSVYTIGITVWETDKVPIPWIPHLRWVDRVTFPNHWNTQTFREQVAGIDTHFLPHPVTLTHLPIHRGDAPAQDTIKELQQLRTLMPSLYVFYTINEFSGRKGLDSLIRQYCHAFTDRDNVVLFIKSHGAIKFPVVQDFIDSVARHYTSPPRLLIDYSRWTEEDIYLLHQEGDCYVSLTRSEGHGLGACHAGLLGKRVIMTRYGGQENYLRGIDWVPCSVEPATFCNFFDPRHLVCMEMSTCRDFPLFNPNRDRWGHALPGAARRLMRRAYEARSVGNSDTVRYLQANFDERAIFKQFEQFIARTLAGEGQRVRLPPEPITDVYNQPKSIFRRQLDVIPRAYRAAPLVKPRLPRVLALGCSGFGNFGDDLYAHMHRVLLKDKVDLWVANTQTFYRKGGELELASRYREGDELLDIDYLFIGGGGLVNDGEINSSILKIYLPWCRARGVPISLMSVGFGYIVKDGRSVSVSAEVARGFAALFEYANLITVRSLTDLENAKSMVPAHRRHRIHALPDLAFGVDAVFPADITIDHRPYVVFCPTNFLSTKFPDVVDLLQQKLWETPGSRLVVLPLDGASHVYPTPFIQEELHRVRTLFPDAEMHQGRYINGDFLKLLDRTVPPESELQTLGFCVGLLRGASCIVTGRYHGVVMAKALGVPYEIGTASLQKLKDEDSSPLDISLWNENYKLLYEDIESTIGIPPLQRSAIDADPDTWDEDVRNTLIVDIVTQSPAPYRSIPFIQNLSNHQIGQRRRSLLLKKRII